MAEPRKITTAKPSVFDFCCGLFVTKCRSQEPWDFQDDFQTPSGYNTHDWMTQKSPKRRAVSFILLSVKLCEIANKTVWRLQTIVALFTRDFLTFNINLWYFSHPTSEPTIETLTRTIFSNMLQNRTDRKNEEQCVLIWWFSAFEYVWMCCALCVWNVAEIPNLFSDNCFIGTNFDSQQFIMKESGLCCGVWCGSDSDIWRVGCAIFSDMLLWHDTFFSQKSYNNSSFGWGKNNFWTTPKSLQRRAIYNCCRIFVIVCRFAGLATCSARSVFVWFQVQVAAFI